MQAESFQEAKKRVIAQFETAYIRGLLLAHQGNITKAAQAAKKESPGILATYPQTSHQSGKLQNPTA